jgi:hypothetical protein
MCSDATGTHNSALNLFRSNVKRKVLSVQARTACADVQVRLHSIFGTRCRRSPRHIPAVLRLGKEQQPGWAQEPVRTPATDRITIPRLRSLITILDPVRYCSLQQMTVRSLLFMSLYLSVCRFPLRFDFCAKMLPAFTVHLLLRR